jgi:uncharacterized membrane protein YGL010W
MQSFIEQAQLYATYHTKKATLYTHLIGVPLIVFSLMIFLGFIHISMPTLFDLTFATICTIALIIYYILLNWRLGLSITPILLILLWLSFLISGKGVTSFSVWFFFITFIVGWAFQFIGHFIEGKRPAFLDNIWQALIAPLYLTAEVYFLTGRMQALEAEIKEVVHFDEGKE